MKEDHLIDMIKEMNIIIEIELIIMIIKDKRNNTGVDLIDRQVKVETAVNIIIISLQIKIINIIIIITNINIKQNLI